jgi:hypothetical protein
VTGGAQVAALPRLVSSWVANESGQACSNDDGISVHGDQLPYPWTHPGIWDTDTAPGRFIATGQAAARWIGVPSTLRMTWMLPRVALE